MKTGRVFWKGFVPFVLSSFVFLVCVSGRGFGQQATLTSGLPGDPDTNAYRLLFRRVLLYQRLMSETAVTDDERSSFKRGLAKTLELSESDSASLHRIAASYKSESEPIDRQIRETVIQFRARLNSQIGDRSLPPRLAELQSEEDGVVLVHRDLLRNAMRIDDFQRLEKRLKTLFAGQAAPPVTSLPAVSDAKVSSMTDPGASPALPRCCVFGSGAAAQPVTGSTMVSLDSVTSRVIATCETDLDATAAAYYNAAVTCTLVDGYDNTLARGASTDANGWDGYAQVTLVISGTPGTVYSAESQHYVDAIDTIDAEPSPESPFTPRYYDYLGLGIYEDGASPLPCVPLVL